MGFFLPGFSLLDGLVRISFRNAFAPRCGTHAPRGMSSCRTPHMQQVQQVVLPFRSFRTEVTVLLPMMLEQVAKMRPAGISLQVDLKGHKSDDWGPGTGNDVLRVEPKTKREWTSGKL